MSPAGGCLRVPSAASWRQLSHVVSVWRFRSELNGAICLCSCVSVRLSPQPFPLSIFLVFCSLTHTHTLSLSLSLDDSHIRSLPRALVSFNLEFKQAHLSFPPKLCGNWKQSPFHLTAVKRSHLTTQSNAAAGVVEVEKLRLGFKMVSRPVHIGLEVTFDVTSTNLQLTSLLPYIRLLLQLFYNFRRNINLPSPNVTSTLNTPTFTPIPTLYSANLVTSNLTSTYDHLISPFFH